MKEVPTVLNQTLNVPVAPRGAVLRGACTPWASLSALPENISALRVNSVRTQKSVVAAGAADVRRLARPVPVTMARLGGTALVGSAAGLPTTFENRKQTVHINKTRMNAGGYGAMGPHPEREPA
jgi:hypothetical protein